jgi:hypothetical protein
VCHDLLRFVHTSAHFGYKCVHVNPPMYALGRAHWVRACACACACFLLSRRNLSSSRNLLSVTPNSTRGPKPFPHALQTAMVSQAVADPLPRPPSLRVVSRPVSRLASAPSRRAATGIRPSIHPSQRPFTFIKGRSLRRGWSMHACAHHIDRGSWSPYRCASPLACPLL